MRDLNEQFKVCHYTYKYLLPPIDDCIWCKGEGYEWLDCPDHLSGYDFRDVCRCMKRDKRFTQKPKPQPH
jgi:hypothetical protein